MDWTQPIDAYCERLGPGFWAEPFNALSNVAFLVAAGVGLSLWQRRGARFGTAADDGQVEPSAHLNSLWLALLVGVIGAGSFLFHTFANRWSVLADVIPIAVFIYVYFGLALYRLIGLAGWISLGATALFLAASLAADPFLARIVGSSSGYVPALLAMVGIGWQLSAKQRPGAKLVLSAGATFAVSLGFRMADQPFCAGWPLGTHFVWHILNAVTLGLLLIAMLRASDARQRPDRPAARN